MFNKFAAITFIIALFGAVSAKADSSVNWTGFYVGGLATYGDGHSRHCDLPNDCATVFANVGMQGWLFGGSLGYNWQTSNWVFGVEGDGSWGHVHGSSEGPNFGCNVLCKTDIQSLSTFRGRLGYAYGTILPYLTAGIGWSDLKGAAGPTTSDSTTRSSFVWGGGIEYAFAPQWSLKLEYLRIDDLGGDFSYDRDLSCGPEPCVVRNVKYDTVRLGLNYRFGH